MADLSELLGPDSQQPAIQMPTPQQATATAAQAPTTGLNFPVAEDPNGTPDTWSLPVSMPSLPPAVASMLPDLQSHTLSPGIYDYLIPGAMELHEESQRNLARAAAPKLSVVDPSIYGPEKRVQTPEFTTDHITQTATNRSPELQAAMVEGDTARAKSEGEQRAEIGKITNIDKTIETERQAYNADAEKQLADWKKRDQAAVQDRQQWLAEQAKQYQELQNMKPADFWQDKSTGQQIGVALAIMAGGVGQGLNGGRGENMAAQALNNAIANDAQLYKAKLDAKMKTFEAAGKGLESVVKAIESDKVGVKMYMEMAGNKLHASLESLKAQASNAETRARIEKQIGDLAVAQANNKAKLEEAIAGSVARVSEVKRLVNQVTPETQAALKKLPPGQQEVALRGIDTLARQVAPNGDPNNLPPIQVAKDLSESDKKSYQFIRENERNAYIMENIEKSFTPEEWSKYQKAWDNIVTKMKAGEGRFSALSLNPGMSWDAVFTALGNDGQNVIADALGEKGVRHFRAALQFANDTTRLVSGATIKDSEQVMTLLNQAVVPIRAATSEAIRDIVIARRNNLKAKRDALLPGLNKGTRTNLFFETSGE